VTITQTDSRTVGVLTRGARFSIPYRFTWSGHERLPESVVLDGREVKAFFLFGTVKDLISEDDGGLLIHRTWTLMTPGDVRLEVRLDFPAPGCSCLFPGVHCMQEIPQALRSVLGEKTGLPSAVFLFHDAGAALIHSLFPSPEGLEASIGVRRAAGEDGEEIVSVELASPPREEPNSMIGPRPGDTREEELREHASPGTLERTHCLRVVIGPREKIILDATRAACRNLGLPPAPTGRAAARRSVPHPGAERTAPAVRDCLQTHLVQEGSVCGLREVPASGFLSSSAGAGMACLILLMFPEDGELVETALRLADFSLKGQHPTGFFYETFNSQKGAWQGVRGRKGTAPLLSTSASARTAESLIELSSLLGDHGLPGEKYWLAGVRFVEFFLDARGRMSPPGALHIPGELAPREASLSGFEILFPLARVLQRSGRDIHAKALDALGRDFGQTRWDGANPPSSREGREPDSLAALTCCRIAALLLGLGRRIGSPETWLSLLLPWVHINRPARELPVDPVGGLVDSFRRQRLLFAGAETAYALSALSAHCTDAAVRGTAAELARIALSFSSRAPLGTAFLQHTRWDLEGRLPEGAAARMGPVDARRLVREAGFLLRLAEPMAVKPAPRR
jgi:hypothetical protein